MADRRSLTFPSLDRVMPDVDVLLQGYRQTGNWSLGQICNHLCMEIKGSVDGFPFHVPWLIRTLFGSTVRKQILRTGKMPDGAKIPEKFAPKPGLDDRAEAEALRAAISLFAAHSEPVIKHPFLGTLSRETMARIFCIHCAHHLGFLWPKAEVRTQV